MLPGRKDGCICFIHVFGVNPVLKHHSTTPDEKDVGITHIVPVNRPIQFLNARDSRPPSTILARNTKAGLLKPKAKQDQGLGVVGRRTALGVETRGFGWR